MTRTRASVDAAVARRVHAQIDRLALPPYTADGPGVTRYAFTRPYQATIRHVGALLRDAGLHTERDPVGNLIASDAAGRRGIGLGSHLDSVRHGGRWDGALGVIAALEVARLNQLRSLGAPLHVVSWIEEEGSGFGQLLLGSRIATGKVSASELGAKIRSLEDGRSFSEHCREAGGDPERAADASAILDRLDRWIEPHIEQGRVLEDAGLRLGIVTTIVGYVHGDIAIRGRADHAGATPMDLRADAGVVAAKAIVAAEESARRAGVGTVATVGSVELRPGAINVVPGEAHLTIDVRSRHATAMSQVLREIREALATAGHERNVSSELTVRQEQPPTPLDEELASQLVAAANEIGVDALPMVSGAAHDTMSLAPHVPSALLFIPCRDGISHAPDEEADASDAALAIAVITGWLASEMVRRR